MINLENIDVKGLFKQAYEAIDSIHENNNDLLVKFKENEVGVYKDKIIVNVFDENQGLEWTYIPSPNICVKVVFKNSHFVYGYYTMYLDMDYEIIEEFYKIYTQSEREKK